MKVVLITLLSILLMGFQSNVSLAQASGKITYETKIPIKLDQEQLDKIPEKMRKLLPSGQTLRNQLLFDAKHSLYSNEIQKTPNENEYSHEDEEEVIQIEIKQPENHYYHVYKTGEVVEESDLYGKIFLVNGKDDYEWKIETATKQIMGYTCTKAITKAQDGAPITAWFASKLTIPAGPANMHSLPGMVLEVEKGGERPFTTTAIELVLEKVPSNLIVAPKRGKKVNRKKFNEIKAAKRAEMLERFGGKGGAHIMIQTSETP